MDKVQVKVPAIAAAIASTIGLDVVNRDRAFKYLGTLLQAEAQGKNEKELGTLVFVCAYSGALRIVRLSNNRTAAVGPLVCWTEISNCPCS